MYFFCNNYKKVFKLIKIVSLSEIGTFYHNHLIYVVVTFIITEKSFKLYVYWKRTKILHFNKSIIKFLNDDNDRFTVASPFFRRAPLCYTVLILGQCPTVTEAVSLITIRGIYLFNFFFTETDRDRGQWR